MTIAAVVTNESQIDEMFSWGNLFCRLMRTDLQIIVTERSTRSSGWTEIEPQSDEAGGSNLVNLVAKRLQNSPWKIDRSGPDGDKLRESSGDVWTPSVTARVLKDRDPGWALVEEVNELKIKLLLLPGFQSHSASEDAWPKKLYTTAPCETILLECRDLVDPLKLRVLVAVTGRQDDDVALRRGLSIATETDGQLTALYVEPDIDAVATDVGYENLNRIVKRAVSKNELEQVNQLVVLGNNLHEGLQEIDLSDFDLILCGTRWQKEIKQLLSLPTSQEDKAPIGLAAIRAPIPFTNRFVNHLQRLVQRWVPQLDRDKRIELVQRIQSSSQWDFDFVALIFLSTVIAALGLVRDSGSVVIGAMLVAPLMTPIVGVGLGVAQGNARLVQVSLRTVTYGFAVSFAIGLLTGWMVGQEITSEMASRGSPDFVDLIIALASGIAAAYALGRPNLLSALPGVAIAAALVPPLATSGIALSLGDIRVCEGSLLLFLCNIVAIILGTAATFMLVGIRDFQKDKRYPAWPIGLVFLLLMTGILLVIAIRSPYLQQL